MGTDSVLYYVLITCQGLVNHVIIWVIKLITSHFSGEKHLTITVRVAASLLFILRSLPHALQMWLRVKSVISFGAWAAESIHLWTFPSFKLDIELPYGSGLLCVS